MAGLGGGAVAYVGLNDSPAEIMDRFIERSSHPALRDIAVDFNGMDVRDLQPGRVPDLFAGRPVIITGRYDGEASAQIELNGIAGTRELSIPVDVSVHEGSISHHGIACIWARSAIAGLENRVMVDHDREIAHAVEELALRYGLASARTSFIAVDASERTLGNFGTTVPVAVPVPDGVQYQTTVDR
jgi:Ca-activated chloride channel family protein